MKGLVCVNICVLCFTLIYGENNCYRAHVEMLNDFELQHLQFLFLKDIYECERRMLDALARKIQNVGSCFQYCVFTVLTVVRPSLLWPTRGMRGVATWTSCRTWYTTPIRGAPKQLMYNALLPFRFYGYMGCIPWTSKSVGCAPRFARNGQVNTLQAVNAQIWKHEPAFWEAQYFADTSISHPSHAFINTLYKRELNSTVTRKWLHANLTRAGE